MFDSRDSNIFRGINKKTTRKKKNNKNKIYL